MRQWRYPSFPPRGGGMALPRLTPMGWPPRRSADCALARNGPQGLSARRWRSDDLLRWEQSLMTMGTRPGTQSARGATRMTGVIEAPGIGHNQPDPLEMEKKNQKWERWAKKRTFVRALEGTYSHLYKTLKEEKRVYSAQDVPWKGGPQMFGKSIVSP